jgi:hypothetical protein
VELIGFHALLASDTYARTSGKKWALVLMIYLPFFAVLLLLTGLLGAAVYFLGHRQWSGALGVSAGTLVVGVVVALVRNWLRQR